MEAAAGFEPAHKGFADLSLTAWVRRQERRGQGARHGQTLSRPRELRQTPRGARLFWTSLCDFPTILSSVMHEVSIGGTGLSRFGKLADSMPTLVSEAVSKAFAEEGNDAIDAVFVGSMTPSAFIGEGNLAALVIDWIGKSGLPTWRVDNASASGASVFQAACMAVASDTYQRALVIGCEKMSALSTPQTTAVLAQVIDRTERLAGASMTALAAMIARRYMNDFGMPYEALARVAVKSHERGCFNPVAHLRKAITLEEAMNARFIAEPLRLYDCAPISDGVAAAIVRKDRSDIRVLGWGSGSDHVAVRNRDSLVSFAATRRAAETAYRMSGLAPSDIDFAEIHDAFTMFEIISMEDLGFAEKGAGWRRVMNGETEKNGAFPVNASGGLKSRGHPVGASGLAQIVEIVNQMRRRAGENQVERIGRALAHSIGGLASSNFVTILGQVSASSEAAT